MCSEQHKPRDVEEWPFGGRDEACQGIACGRATTIPIWESMLCTYR